MEFVPPVMMMPGPESIYTPVQKSGATSVIKSYIAVLVCVLATATAAGQSSGALAEKGKMVVASNGARLGLVYRVGTDGSAQMIIDGKLVSIPAATLSNADGKLTTNLTKSEVIALH